MCHQHLARPLSPFLSLSLSLSCVQSNSAGGVGEAGSSAPRQSQTGESRKAADCAEGGPGGRREVHVQGEERAGRSPPLLHADGGR